ncbi:hypothetical protein TOPH_09274 [Tolypocladium ophioglossoides CBS 100239]|uniref:Subtilisin-like serine protease n=1 Tax=Tolypocladium ophioglossoides (strain CBS 100239) TaxID=1163406 RepID=A0A0L0MVW6_TOLOC|nr:hypothetical protein TOPH_09274 [Tolypocladium ophioglossoides CBS 100239]
MGRRASGGPCRSNSTCMAFSDSAFDASTQRQPVSFSRRQPAEAAHSAPALPFSIRLLDYENEQAADASRRGHDQLLSLLPASYRIESGDLAAAGRHVTACIEKELDLRRLASIHSWLWVAGLPMPPRLLHYQLLLSREVFATERMDMHLVWTIGRVFLKPIPRFLLDPRFWAEYLCCAPGCGCSLDETAANRSTTRECERGGLRRRALGFLFSYAAESTCFRRRYSGLHGGRSLSSWIRSTSIQTLIRDSTTASCTPLRGYMAHWNQYGAFFHDHFAWLASATVYIAIVLTAMQVGLATESLARNNTFQSASYGFAVFSILGPLIAASLIILAFCCVFVSNWFKALDFRKRRLAMCVPSE